VVPLLGLGWGFDVRDEAITLHEIAPLAAGDWEGDVSVLRAVYPSPFWTFADSI
jgi:hypothetical protein